MFIFQFHFLFLCALEEFTQTHRCLPQRENHPSWNPVATEVTLNFSQASSCSSSVTSGTGVGCQVAFRPNPGPLSMVDMCIYCTALHSGPRD